MGLGLNGGGEAVVRFFLKYGAFVTVTDTKSKDELQKTIRSLNEDKTLNKQRLTFHLGGHIEEDFSGADCVIKNPIIKYEGNKYLSKAKVVETDLSVFLSLSKAPIIAVTGSKGKSTTASAIHYGLSQTGLITFLGGNITVSPLSFFEKTNETTPVVLELSSWQLRDLRGRKLLKPHISIITKIVQDHQNWYTSMEEYIDDKCLIYKDQTETSYSIFSMQNATGETPLPKGEQSWGDFFAKNANSKIFRYSNTSLPKGVYGVWHEKDKTGNTIGKIFLPGMKQEEPILSSILVPGEHNYENVLNAALVMALMKIRLPRITQILSSWKGIPHRLQYFYKADDGTLFYNDTCSTVPEATALACNSFDKKIILIAGGTDKNLNFTPLVNTLKSTPFLKSLYLLEGSGTTLLVELLQKENISFYGPFSSLNQLLTQLKQNEKNKNQIVVFSPGCTSFGMFKNEFDRGESFIKEVRSMWTGKAE